MKNLIVRAVLLAASAFAPVRATAMPAGTEVPLSAADVAVSSLERRDGEIYCGDFAPGDGIMADKLINNLKNDNLHSIPPASCYRVQCKDTTAIYVCNDNGYTLNVQGSEITIRAENIFNRCCLFSADNKEIFQAQMAGQQFADAVGGNWNVVIGYGNCKHSSTEKPSDIGGWGVNGAGCQTSNWYIG